MVFSIILGVLNFLNQIPTFLVWLLVFLYRPSSISALTIKITDKYISFISSFIDCIFHDALSYGTCNCFEKHHLCIQFVFLLWTLIWIFFAWFYPLSIFMWLLKRYKDMCKLTWSKLEVKLNNWLCNQMLQWYYTLGRDWKIVCAMLVILSCVRKYLRHYLQFHVCLISFMAISYQNIVQYILHFENLIFHPILP